MKRLPGCLAAFFLVIFTINGFGADIYVSSSGHDSQAGTIDQPLASLSMALRKARELRRLHDPSIASGIHIIIKGGTYPLAEPIFIRPEDSGTKESPTIIEAANGERVVLSGGIQLSGWSPVKTTVPGLPAKANGKVWMLPLPSDEYIPAFRQLWINDKKAIRARDQNNGSMSRIFGWNKADESCWIPLPKTNSLKNTSGLEMTIHQWWAIADLRIKKMEVHGDSAKLFFMQPESRVQNEHPWPAPWISKETGNSAFYLSNALQFLDEPGEWWLDASAKKLYYWPRSNENLRTAVTIVPVLETLLSVAGTPESPVSYLTFKNICFEHSGWLRPSQQGHVPHQAGMYMLDAYKLKIPGTPDKKTLENQAWVGRPAAAVSVSYADHTDFESCSFTHIASTALDYGKATHNCSITGNYIGDVGGTGILAGIFSDESSEVHIPYYPKDENDVCSGLSIRNNLVTDVTNEDWGCVGIGAGYVRDILIEHNEICNVNYTGISMGWGWTKTENVMRNNTIAANKIHHYGKEMYDVAAIYTLSAQPGTIIRDNYIDSIYKAPYAHIPTHWFYLYTDEGSSNITVKNNWTPSNKYLQNANGPGNVWENNGPQVSATVRQEAGLEPSYRHLAAYRSVDENWPINKEQPVIIELTVAATDSVDASQIRDILQQTNNAGAEIYRWKNHSILFGFIHDLRELRSKLSKAFPQATAKTYDDPFYEFNRRHCSDTSTARQWEHTIITAQMVADPQLQKEYLAYHATQFRDWPEVSNGFCNADFQRLLVYRNGRQLMLVISIPKGESLDRLNPKTTESNPRVDEWNRRMKKYQQGLLGTEPGETWVFLAPESAGN